MTDPSRVTYLIGSDQEPAQMVRLISCLRADSLTSRVVIARVAGRAPTDRDEARKSMEVPRAGVEQHRECRDPG